MEKVDEQVIDRIKKLLEHHEGCIKINSEQEAMVAMDLAKKLMTKYHLDMMQIVETSTDFISHMQADKFSVYTVPIWVCNLINVVNNICNCSCVLDKDPQPNGYIHIKVMFVTPKDELQHVADMYKFFKKTVHKLANEHVRSINGNSTNWRSFAEGFTSRLLERSRSLNSDDDFGDIEIDNEVDILSDRDDELRDNVDDEEAEEFSDIIDDDGEVVLKQQNQNKTEKSESAIDVKKNSDLSTYLHNVKIQINKYIFNQFHAKQEKLKTKTRVLQDSYMCGRQKADTQSLTNPKEKDKDNAIH